MNIDRVASIADMIFGGWLFLSLFLWRDTTAQMMTTAIVGGGSVALGYLSLHDRPWARWIVGGLAVWVIFAMFTLPGLRVATVFNHLLMGTLLFGFSVLPTNRVGAQEAFLTEH